MWWVLCLEWLRWSYTFYIWTATTSTRTSPNSNLRHPTPTMNPTSSTCNPFNSILILSDDLFISIFKLQHHTAYITYTIMHSPFFFFLHARARAPSCTYYSPLIINHPHLYMYCTLHSFSSSLIPFFFFYIFERKTTC